MEDGIVYLDDGVFVQIFRDFRELEAHVAFGVFGQILACCLLAAGALCDQARFQVDEVGAFG